ncbi:MAG: hypothetical protein ABEJ22_07895 [Haloferacaceae archaeon]
MALGILDTVGLAATLVFAIPVFVFGVQKALAGDALFGGGLVVVAALMVLLPRRLTTPGDVPSKVAEKAVERTVVTDDEE